MTTPTREDLPDEKTDSQAPALRIAILYQPHAQPDEEVQQWLEAQLTAQGHAVFIDRHLTIGVEWATEIARWLQSADAVIPLLSAAAVGSEMLAWEVKLTRDAAAARQGVPRLLPVRLNYTGPLSEELGNVLDALQQFSWTGPQDNLRLLADVEQALRGPIERPPQPVSSRRVGLLRMEESEHPPGGAVPLGSPFYIERSIDTEFHAALARHDSIVLVKGARQMGKTSLLYRGLHEAHQSECQVVLTDLEALNSTQLTSIEAFWHAIGAQIADQLDLAIFPDEYRQSHANLGPNMNFERYLQREVLGKIPGRLVWGLDEVDRLFTYPFHNEVFSLMRSWHNRRAAPKGAMWQRLTLAMAYATEAHLFITNLNQSPFNVGTHLTLEDFTAGQVAELNHRYGSPLYTAADVAAFCRLLGGHPALVSQGLYALRQRPLDMGTFCAQAPRDDGPFGQHLRRMLFLLVDSDLRRAVEDVLQGRPCPDQRSFDRLHSAGVLAGSTLRDAQLRCSLYATYLRQHLLEERV